MIKGKARRISKTNLSPTSLKYDKKFKNTVSDKEAVGNSKEFAWYR